MLLAIKNVTILSAREDAPPFFSGAVVIKEDIISGIYEKLPEDLAYDRVVDGKHGVLTPGLINTHTHAAMIPLRNYANDLPLHTWLFDKIMPVEDTLVGDDVYWATLLAICEMIQGGTTCFADMYFFMDHVAEAVLKAGIRADLSRGLTCFDEGFKPNEDQRLLESVELINKWQHAGDGRIKVRLGPHAIYTCVPSYLREIRELSNAYNVGIHIHLSETRKEVEDSLQQFGVSPVKHLANQGLLNENTLAAHCVHLCKEDSKLLKDYGVHIAHCPGSNLKLGSGIAPLPKYLSQGINISLGTDSVASNNNLNMLEEMHLTALMSKGVTENPLVLPAWEVLKMATTKGAKALGMDSYVGQIKEGMKADLTLLDVDKPHLFPLQDPCAALVYSAQASDVTLVMVNGQILYENGAFTTLDIEEIRQQNQRVFKRLFP